MNGQPAPKTQELLNSMDSLLKKRRRPIELEIRRLKKEAEKLRGKIELADYYDFLGMIAALENDKAGIIKNHEEALKLSPNNYEIQRNYIAIKNHGVKRITIFIQILYDQKLLNIFLPSKT